VLSVLTMTVGNLVAIWQNNLKRLLAYSSIAHAGYMLMGLVVLRNEGIAAILVYFAVYLFMNLGAFYTVMLIANKIGTEDIEDYKGLGPRAPFVTVSLSIFLISLIGLPLTGGFIGKFYLFAALLDSGWYWLALVGGLNSVVALYYYLRVLRNMYLKSDDEPAASLIFSRWEKSLVLLLLVPTVLFGVYFVPIVNLAQAAVRIYGTP
jgi:NADH-quinone oxidoreductase subunit N